MSLPLALHKVSVLRRPTQPLVDPYERADQYFPAATGVRANIGTPSGREINSVTEVTQFRLTCDVTDIRHNDRIRDDATGEVYDIDWVNRRSGLGLDHMEAAIRKVEGVGARG